MAAYPHRRQFPHVILTTVRTQFVERQQVEMAR
jgi:hypothetical protein